MKLKSTYTIRFTDCDPLGHLNNARYIDYMLNAREDHLKEFYNVTMPEFHRQGIAWVVKTHTIQYVRPALYTEQVTIVSRVVEFTQSYLVLEVQMLDQKEQSVKAIMWSNFACIDPQTGKRKDHTPAFMEFAQSTMEVHPVDLAAGIEERVRQLQTELKASATT